MKIKRCFLLFFTIVLFNQFAFSQTTSNNDDTQELRTKALRFYQQRNFNDSIKLLEKIVNIKRIKNGANSIEVAKALYDLAIVEVQAKKKKNASKTLTSSISILESQKELSVENKNFLSIVYELMGITRFQQKEVKDSINYYAKALKIKETIYPSNSLVISKTMFFLANLYTKDGDAQNAKDLYKKVIDIKLNNLDKIDFDEVNDALARYNCMCNRVLIGDADRLQINNKVRKASKEYYDKKLVKGGILNGKAKKLAIPRYPTVAALKGQRGSATVEVIIDEQGEVTFACAIGGSRSFFAASEEAALKSKFNPTVINGKPVKVSGIIVYNYNR